MLGLDCYNIAENRFKVLFNVGSPQKCESLCLWMPSSCCSCQELRRRPPQHLEGRHRDFPHWEVRQFPYRETLTGTCSTGLLRNLLLCPGLSQLLPHEEVDIVPSLKLSSVCLNNETHQKFLQHRRSDIGILLVRRSPRRSTLDLLQSCSVHVPTTGHTSSSSTTRRFLVHSQAKIGRSKLRY